MQNKKQQRKIEQEWEQVWQSTVVKKPEQIFEGFLFNNGYQAFKNYFPETPYSLLEIGAGSGRYGLALARAHKHATVTVTDPTDASVNLIAKVQNALDLPNVTVQKEDALCLSFADGQFDFILADAVIQHIVDYPDAIIEMLRVLKPGGSLVVSAVNTYNPPHFLYKKYLKLRNKPYEYDYENTFSRYELRAVLNVGSVHNVKLDGFGAAYGLIRLRRFRAIYGKLGSVLHKLIKLLDKVTNRWVTRVFGFEIFAVAVKKTMYEK